MPRNDRRLEDLLGTDHPIVQGPFGGGLSTVRLTAAVADAGGLGSFGAHGLEPERIIELVAELGGCTDRAFAVNLWIPQAGEAEASFGEADVARLRPYYDRFELPDPVPAKRPEFAEQVQALLAAQPPVISFVMGIPPAVVLAEARRRGIVTIGTATTVDEAIALEAAGLDVIVASGSDAGGHRGAFLRPAAVHEGSPERVGDGNGGVARLSCPVVGESRRVNDQVKNQAKGREVLVVGAYFADLIFRDLPRPVRPGTEVFAEGFSLLPGGAFTPAMAMRRLGHDVVWATDFGTDVFSRQVLSDARAEGLDEAGFRHHPGPLRSVTVALSDPGDRAMVSYQDPVGPQPLAELLRRHRPRVLVLSELRYGDGVQAALRVAHQLGAEVCMDCQDIPATLGTPGVREVLAEVDVFAPNADEALRLTGADTIDDALEVLAGLVDTVVVKRGGAGATAVRGGKRDDVGAVPVEAVDTTGAGDCFNAGFLHARLAGESLPGCLAAAVACGAAATTGPGSSAAPDADGLRRWLALVP